MSLPGTQKNTEPGMLDFVRSSLANALQMSQAAYDTTVQQNPIVQQVLASLVNPANPVQSTPVQFATRKSQLPAYCSEFELWILVD